MAINNPYSETPTKTAEKILDIEYGNTKQDRINQEATRKKTTLNGGFAPTEYDFLTLNPNATEEQLALYRQEAGIRDNRQKLADIYSKRAADVFATTTAGEDITDAIGSVAKGGIAVGETVYGIADLASRYNLGSQAYKLATGEETTSLDELVGGAEFFSGLRDSVGKAYDSDKQQSINERRELFAGLDTQISEEKKVKDIAAGDSELWAEAKNIARQAGKTAQSLKDNPSQIVLGAIEELPSLLTGGLVGKKAVAALSANVAKESGKRFLKSDAAKDLIQTIQDEAGTKILAKELGQKAADRFLRTDAGKEAAKKAATNAGVGSAAIEEAMSNAMQTKAEVLKLTEEDVKDEPIYKAFRDQGMSHEKALQETSQKAFDIVTLLVLPTAGAISKVTGAGGLEGRVFLKGSALGNTITSKLGATGIEAVEEGIQSGTGQTFQNIAAQETFESGRSTTKGVGQAIGEGAVIGAGTGTVLGSLGTTGEVLGSASKDTKKLVENVDKVVKAGAKKLARATDTKDVKEARKTGDATKVTDTTNASYNPTNAFTTLVSPEFVPVPTPASEGVEAESDEAFDKRSDEYLDKLDVHMDKQREKVQSITNEVAKLGEGNPKEKARLDKEFKAEIKILKDMQQTYTGISGILGTTDLDKSIKELKAKPENKDVLLGSMRLGIDSPLSVGQAESVLKNANLTNPERKQVEAFIQAKKSTQEVSDQVRNGDKNNLGLNQYTQLINDAVSTGNKDNARATLVKLTNFAKGMKDKAQAARKAYDEVKASSDPQAEQNISGKSWGLNITKRSPESLITNIEKDTEAVIASLNSLKAYSVATFNGEGTDGTTTIRESDSTSNESGVDNTTGGQQSGDLFGGNQTTLQPDRGVSGGNVTPTRQNGTGTSGRVADDDAVIAEREEFDLNEILLIRAENRKKSTSPEKKAANKERLDFLSKRLAETGIKGKKRSDRLKAIKEQLSEGSVTQKRLPEDSLATMLAKEGGLDTENWEDLPSEFGGLKKQGDLPTGRKLLFKAGGRSPDEAAERANELSYGSRNDWDANSIIEAISEEMNDGDVVYTAEGADIVLAAEAEQEALARAEQEEDTQSTTQQGEVEQVPPTATQEGGASETETPNQETKGEIHDLVGILGLLGVKAKSTAQRVPTLTELMDLQQKVLSLIASKNLNRGSLQTIFNNVDWAFADTSPETVAHIKDRNKRAQSKLQERMVKAGLETKEEYLAYQIIEELGEVGEASLSKNETKQKELLDLQKAVLKIIRFGFDTNIKDSDGNPTEETNASRALGMLANSSIEFSGSLESPEDVRRALNEITSILVENSAQELQQETTPTRTRGGRNAAGNAVVQAAADLETYDLAITEETDDTPETNAGLTQRLNTLIDSVLAVDVSKYSDNVKRIQATFQAMQNNPTLQDGREVDLARAMVREIRQTDESTRDLFGAAQNEEIQQSSDSSQSTSEQASDETQTEEITDVPQTGDRTDSIGEFVSAVQSISTGILSTGRKYANRLSTLFRINPKKNKMNQTTDLFNELDTLEGITEEQRVALERIGKFKEVMTKAIDKLIKMKPELTKGNPYAAVDKNMIQLLMADGNDTLSEGLDPNVLNLMAIAGIQWLATRGKETLNRTPSDVAAMLGISENTMSKEVLDYYLLKGVPSYLITQNIGKDVITALGLSLDKNNAPRETQDRMAQSIGGVVFAAMHEMGLLESELAENIPNVNGDYVNDSFESNQEGDGKRIKMTKLMENPTSSAAIGLFNKVESILEDITSIENEFKMPSLEAPTTTVTKNQRGTQDLTKSQKKALQNYAQKAFKLNSETMMMFDLVGDDVLKTAMGYDFSLREVNGQLSSNTTHTTKLTGAKGKNNQIERSISNLKAFKQHLLENGTDGIDSDFFFESVVDNNNRFRINNKVVNPQGDKLHRAAMVMEGWEYTVDDERSRTLYLLALGQSLGVKVDKLEIGDSIADTMKVLAKPEIKRAITALQRLRNGEPRTPEATKILQRLVQEGVKEAGEGSHSLEGLISYMDYSETVPFESTLSIEIDGITNGTALATLLFAQAGATDTLAKSGIFSDGQRSYGEYISKPTNEDNYETVASALTAELNAIIAGTWTDSKDEPFDPKLVGLLRPIGNILGKLKYEGDDTYGLIRNIAKNPVLIGNYGAGVSKISSEFVEEVLDKVYQHIEQAVADGDQARLDLLYRELSTVFTKKPLPKLTLANGLSWEMNKTQTSIFKTRVRQTFGKIMNSALEKQFAPLKEARDNYNTMLNAANAMFRAAYAVESGKILDKKGFLTVADEEYLSRLLAPLKPEIKHGQVLKGDGNSTHVPLNTTELRINRKSRFATEVDFLTAPANHPNDRARQIFSPEREYVSNGVKGTVFTVQSTDSAVMVDTLLKDYPALNIYDAVIVNPMNAVQAAKDLNESTISITKRTRVYRDTAESLKKVMTRFTKNDEYLQQLEVSGYLENEVLPTGADPATNPMDMVRDAMAATNSVEAKRKVMFDNIQYTVQYNFEGAGYDTSSEQQSSEYHVKQFVAEVKNSNISKLGSTPQSGNTSYSNSVTEHEVKANNIVGLMGMLSKISGVKSSVSHAKYLAELLGDTYNSFVATTKLKVARGANLNVGQYNLTTGDVKVATKAGGRQSPFEMGSDEVFAHEMIHSMTVAALQTASLFSREVRKLMMQAQKSLTVEDFMEEGGTRAEAQKKYDYIFNNPDKINGYSAGVFEFVAYGLTNEKFRQLLRDKVDTKTPVADSDKSILGRLRALYSKLLDTLTARVTNTNNLNADEKLNVLVRKMMTHEEAAKQRVYNASLVNKIEGGFKSGLINYVQQPLVDFLGREGFKKDSTSSNRLVRGAVTVGQGAAAVTRISLKGEFGEFRKVLNKVAKRMGATENNLFVSLMTEMQGRTPETNQFYQLARESRKTLDQARADISANVKNHIKKQFKRDLTTKEEQALTKVLIKTDLSVLTTGFSAEEIYDLVTDKISLAKEIRKAESDVNKFGLNAVWYLKQANSLAHYLVTGKFTEKFPLKNAHAISRLVGLNRNVPANAEQAEAAIDKLTTLKALQIASTEIPEDMALVVKLFEEEFENKTNLENNGIMFTLLHHSDYKERALENLFAGNKMQTIKGYIREIYNPNKSFQVAPEADVELMARDGFVRVEAVAKDPLDPNALPMAMYISDMGQLASWQAGGVSLASMTAKGSKYYDTVANSNTPNNMQVSTATAKTVKQRKEQAARDIYAGITTSIPRTTLVPVLDETGQVTDFHYLMQESTKDLLDRNNKLSDIMGSMEANMKSKVSGKEINDKYVKALTEDARDNFATNQEKYSYVGLNSSRSDLEELYKMLPQEMRHAIKNETGQDGIWVRDEIIKLVFGQRKFSVAHYFKEKAQLGEANTRLGNKYLNNIYHKLGSTRVAKLEKGWQEVIAYVKDTIVIKSIETLLGNIASNNVLLWSMGVSVKDLVSNQERAIRYAEDYQANQDRIQEIEREIVVTGKKQNSLINRNLIKKLEIDKTLLEDKQLVNPIHGLIEAGIYQSIIDDVDMLDDGFNYKTNIENWVAPVTDKIPNSLKTMASYVTLSQDNKFYQFLRRSTQLSDFAARFALHEHNLKKGMDSRDSINMIVDVFIDYDLPTHKGIEYLNSVGGVFFTKFFIRIQKVIFHTLKDSPARFFGLHYLQELFGNISDIFDSFGLTKDLSYMFKTPLGALGGITDMHPVLNMIK